ncbi:hypothetical protein CKM354_001291900 [Cercospora kikuchii]|uniref:Uncharacterized protein n=1 Tax=Cercospora kikuchii TaxID=84275 RepID=A0A9P3L386_9PEZI|nr:uncharacterized protein CKM354_001291900 [Cercospora kikuchii]GIZ49902.1 hypothetical protein CKM354_001291900 [Cercospora kikuchii]
MAWIWSSTSSKEPARPPSPAPSQAPSPVVDNLAAEVPTSTPENDKEDYMLDVQPRGLKRKADDDEEEIRIRGFKVVYNSSKVIPAISKMHNDSVSTQPAGEHLLHLPESVQRLIYSFVLVDEAPYDVLPQGQIVPQPVVSWDINDNNSLVKRHHNESDGSPLREAPGLLTVCKQVRELAVPIFFVGNSFNIQVSNFDGLAIQPFWKLMDSHRKKAETKPILLAGSHDEREFFEALLEKSAILLDGLDDHVSSLPTRITTSDFMIRRLYEAPTTPLEVGGIRCDLDYEPNWDNLLAWLIECLKGRLPLYVPGDLTHHREGRRLGAIELLFKATELYKPIDVDDFLKTIATHRGHLIRDDHRWAPPPEHEDVEESQTLRHTTPMESPRETPSKQLVFTSSPPLPQCSSTSKPQSSKGYQHARESLGPAFRKSTSAASSSSDQRVEVRESDDEEDTDDEQLVCHTSKKRKIDTLVDLDGEPEDEDADKDGEAGEK